MSLCLTKDELIELTNRQKYKAQRIALNTMGIDYHVRPDGSLAVFRDALNKSGFSRQTKRTEPNWNAVH